MDDNVLPFRTPEPRRESILHKGIRVTITYEVAQHTWRWEFKFTHVIDFKGTATTLDEAKKAAIKKIEDILP